MDRPRAPLSEKERYARDRIATAVEAALAKPYRELISKSDRSVDRLLELLRRYPLMDCACFSDEERLGFAADYLFAKQVSLSRERMWLLDISLDVLTVVSPRSPTLRKARAEKGSCLDLMERMRATVDRGEAWLDSFGKARAIQEGGEVPKHRDMCVRALRLLLQDIGELAQLLGEVEKSVATYQEAVEKYGSFKGAYFLVNVFTMGEEKDIDLALYFFDELLRTSYQDGNDTQHDIYLVQAQGNITKYYKDRGEYEKAKDFFESTLPHVVKKISSVQAEFVRIWKSEEEDLDQLIKERQSIAIPDEAMVPCVAPDLIPLLDEEARALLLTAYAIHGNRAELCTPFDYSAEYAPLAKCLESALFTVFGEYYLRYLHGLEGLDLSQVDRVFKHRDPKTQETVLRTTVDRFEIGDAMKVCADVVGPSDGEDVDQIEFNPLFLGFCEKWASGADPTTLCDFWNDLNKARLLRNKIAHRHRILFRETTKMDGKLWREDGIIHVCYRLFAPVFRHKKGSEGV